MSYISSCGRRTPDGQILENDTMVADYLLKAARVASVPGVAYGLSPYFRISTATSDPIVGEAIARIAAAVAEAE